MSSKNAARCSWKSFCTRGSSPFPLSGNGALLRARTLSHAALSALLAVLLFLAPAASFAATVTFKTPVTISGDSDVLNIGSTVFAYNFYSSGGSVNGVSFTNSTSTTGVGNLGLALTGGAYSASLSGSGTNFNALSPTYKLLLSGAVYGDAIPASSGLTANYYGAMNNGVAQGGNFGTPILTTNTPQIAFDWGSGGVGGTAYADYASARFTGKFTPGFTETYTFYTQSDDGMRVAVNGVNVVSSGWIDQGGSTYYSGTVSLTAGVPYDISVEYYENGGGAVCKLYWSSPSQTGNVMTLMPASAFVTAVYPKPMTLTLNGLTVNKAYAVQLWANDSTGSYNARSNKISGGGTAVSLDVNAQDVTGGVGQFTIGSFVANATSQTISVVGAATSGGTSTQINAVQLRDITGVWSGAASNVWDSNAVNWSGGQAFSSIPAGTPLTFADVDGTGTAVTNSSPVIQAAGISSSGTVIVTSNTVNYTLGTSGGTLGLTGAASLSKPGASTLTLSGTHSFTGGINLTGGTLITASLGDRKSVV